MKTENPPVILDIRSENEWKTGHIEGGINIPLPHLQERLDELPKEKMIVVHCASGYRSAIAASLLLKNGLSDIHDLVGGFSAWQKSL